MGWRCVQSRMQAGRLEGKVEEVQLLGRLLSTRHKTVQLAAEAGCQSRTDFVSSWEPNKEVT